jgi:hypothetical protein
MSVSYLYSRSFVLITGAVPVVGTSEHSNDPAGSEKGGEFIDERTSAPEAVFCLVTYSSFPQRKKNTAENPKGIIFVHPWSKLSLL